MTSGRFTSFSNTFKYSFSKREAHTVLTVVLLSIYVLMVLFKSLGGLFLIQGQEINAFIREYFYFPSDFSRFITKPWTILSSLFLHTSLGHVLSNVLIVFFFGQMLENLLGKKQVWQTFLIGGAVGCLAYVLALQTFPIFENVRYSSTLVGASGGAFAIMIALVTLSPNYSINLFGLLPLKVKWIALFFVVSELMNISDSNAGGHFAHFGGMVFGFLFIRYTQGRINFPKFGSKTSNKSYRNDFKVTVNKDYDSSKVDNIETVSQKEIDVILDKISRSGYNSLSKKEKETLFKASKK